ncbi:MAG TPA: hypothetical protein VGH92_03275 [Gaiellaceae bacterium]|jgi:hypothetical protein
MIAPDRSFPNGSPVCDYWLSRCEGFVVRAGHRTLGVVETVGRQPGLGRADTIVLRRQRRRMRSIPAEDVLAVVPARKILLARRHHQAGPALRHGYETAAPVVVDVAHRTAAAIMAMTRWLVSTLRREVPRLVRFLLAEIHDRNQHHGAEPGIGRAHRRANDYDYGLNTRAR